MAVCERAGGSGFQVFLEASGVRLIRGLDHHMSPPGAVLRRMCAVAFVVPYEPPCHVAGNADVVSRRRFAGLQHVHKTLKRHLAVGASVLPVETRPYAWA